MLSTITPIGPPAIQTISCGKPICEPLPWDSEFFGLNIGRVAGKRLTADEGRQALEWCRQQAIDCLYFLADASDAETAQAATMAGFRFVDVRCVYECNLPRRGHNARASTVRGVEPADLPELEAIAAAQHTPSRFHFDLRFQRERARKLFETWIRNSCRGWADAVFVAGFAGEPAGYVTCHVHDRDRGSIGLIAVDSRFQRQGFGRQLVSAALDYCENRGLASVEVATQGRNIHSQQLYQSCGFTLRSVETWYHLWPQQASAEPWVR